LSTTVPPVAIAVVVLSLGPRPTLIDAVRSLCDQDEKAEIVIVHTGPGDAAALLRSAGLDVRVVSSPRPMYPGGVRNVGVAATRAPIVAFLADDCEARPGWVRLRREAHEAGHDAVASALVSHRPYRPIALAAHVSLFVNRLPGAKPRFAQRYGVSYRRVLLERVGPFREDLRAGEDSDLNDRIGAPEAIHWDPRIQTAHHGTERLCQFLADQAQRGRRMVDTRLALQDGMANRVVVDAIVRTGRTLRRSVGAVESRQVPVLALAAPLVVMGGVAYACGAAARRHRP
jgi:glycosyltransferase involved in cell wall biosynthesis